MPKHASIELVWPIAGIDRSLGFNKQPPYTTPEALNVRTDEMSQYRERGGSRPGLGLAIRTQLPAEIRLLTSVSVLKAQWGKNYAPIGGTGLRDTLLPVPWAASPTYLPSSSNQGLSSGIAGNSWGQGIPVVDQRDSTKPYEATAHVRLSDQTGISQYNGEARLYLGLLGPASDPAEDGVEVALVLENGEYFCRIQERASSSVVQTVISPTFDDNPNSPGVFAVHVVPGTLKLTAWWRDRELATITVASLPGDYVSAAAVSPDDSLVVTLLSTEFGIDTAVSSVYHDLRRDVLVAVSNGQIFMEDNADSLRLITTDLNLNPNVELTATDREQKLYIADYGITVTGSGASVAATDYNELTDGAKNFPALGVTENFALEIVDSDYSQNEKQEVAVDTADGGTFLLSFMGLTTDPLAWDISAGQLKIELEELVAIDEVTVTKPEVGRWVVEFTGDHAGKSQDQLSADATNLTYSGVGSPTVSINRLQNGAGGEAMLGQYAITGVTGSTLTFSPPLAVAEGFTDPVGAIDYRIVRAPKIFDPREETLTLHTASTGFTPAGCRLVTLYRDRIVYAGSDLLPHVWYMSRQGDPDDWDYSQEDSAAAVAAQNSIAGQLADPITAIIPHSDECLVFGCYNSLWILRGDPGFGGTLDQLSHEIGIVSPRAWCRTPDDMLVFLSPDGLYVMPAGCAGFPTSLSRERLPDELLCLNASRESVHLQYDMLHRGVHIFVTRRDGSESPHWWFDWEAKAFWRVGLQSQHEPYASHQRIAWDTCPIILVAGRDGVIRYFDRQFEVDDGNNIIQSYCDIGPFYLVRGGIDEGLLSELVGVLGNNSGPVKWWLRVGDSAESAFLAADREEGRWARNGQNYRARPRARGVAAVLRVGNQMPQGIETTTRGWGWQHDAQLEWQDGDAGVWQGSVTTVGTEDLGRQRRWYLERITSILTSAGRRRVR